MSNTNINGDKLFLVPFDQEERADDLLDKTHIDCFFRNTGSFYLDASISGSNVSYVGATTGSFNHFSVRGVDVTPTASTFTAVIIDNAGVSHSISFAGGIVTAYTVS